MSAALPMSESDSWPEHLDALVAAPRHHTLLFENEAVRILDTRIKAGDRTPVHTHRWPAALYILSWSSFVRRDARGEIVVDSRTLPFLAKPPQVLWIQALGPHSLENVGSSDLHVINFEIKYPSSIGATPQND
jgi:quercetin dioxygenase-like cupin family protein